MSRFQKSCLALRLPYYGLPLRAKKENALAVVNLNVPLFFASMGTRKRWKGKSLCIVELKNTLFFLISFSDLLFKVKSQSHNIQDRKMAHKVVSASVPYEGQHLYSVVPEIWSLLCSASNHSSNIDTVGYIPTHFSKTVKLILIFVVILWFWGFLYFLFSFFPFFFFLHFHLKIIFFT